LNQDASTVAFVVDKAQQVEGLDESAQLLQCSGKPCRTVVGLKGTGEAGCTHDSEFQRSGETQQVVPMFSDEPHVDLIGSKIVEHTVVGFAVDTPESAATHIRADLWNRLLAGLRKHHGRGGHSAERGNASTVAESANSTYPTWYQLSSKEPAPVCRLAHPIDMPCGTRRRS
jgi:hypothetical protein